MDERPVESGEGQAVAGVKSTPAQRAARTAGSPRALTQGTRAQAARAGYRPGRGRCRGRARCRQAGWQDDTRFACSSGADPRQRPVMGRCTSAPNSASHGLGEDVIDAAFAALARRARSTGRRRARDRSADASWSSASRRTALQRKAADFLMRRGSAAAAGRSAARREVSRRRTTIRATCRDAAFAPAWALRPCRPPRG